MLCNGNLSRISWEGNNFRDLNHATSLVNALAYEGYAVAIVHRRSSEWIYSRFGWETLKVPNRFSEDVDFETCVKDLDFLIDGVVKACELKQLNSSGRVVVIGFSMGGMELLNVLAFKRYKPHLAKAIFLGTPVNFRINRNRLISLFLWYSQIARFMPVKEYHALNMVSREMAVIKEIVRKTFGEASPKVLRWALKNAPLVSPLVSEVFNIDGEEFDPESILPVISYVLEPLPTRVIDDLLYMVRKGRLVSRHNGDADILRQIEKKYKGAEKFPPWLVIGGIEDRLITQDGQDMLSGALIGLNPNGRHRAIPGCGHVDSVYSQRVVAAIIEDLKGTY